VIVIEVELPFEDLPKASFEECSYNENIEVQAWSQVKGVK